MTARVGVLLDAKEAVAEFVRTRVPACERGWTGYSAIGFVLDGKLIAGTVYHDWEPEWGVLQMSSAADSPRWLTRDTLRIIFSIPFKELHCRNVVMRVSSLNARMCSIAERFGFTAHPLPDLRAPGEDDVIYLLSREAWANGRFC